MSTAATPAEIELFRSLLSREVGIDCARHGATFLERRLLRRMSAAGARSLYEYYRLVAAPGARELQELVDDVAVHETAFFRNPAHFEALRATVLPERSARRAREGRRCLRVWSAGCSTGQEAWSLAMTMLETLVAGTWEVRLLASDVSARALGVARRGIYSAAQLEPLTPERRRRFFEPCPEGLRVRAFARRGVEFQLGNLLDPPPWSDLDVILCRNVMIYFDQDRQRRLLERVCAALAPGGFLFLGQTEGLADAELPLEMRSSDGALFYRRRA